MKILNVLIPLLCLLAAACSPTVATRGNMISPAKFGQVQAEKSTRADVVLAWGPPTAESPFDPNTWYYIGETTAQKGIYAPEVVTRRMVRVKFDPARNDLVTEVADLDPALAKNIDPVSRTTPTAGREFTALQQFVGNIGKYNKGEAKK